MATTADDWTYAKFLTAITTAGNIPIDIIAQTLGNIDVNVATAETIPIDIKTQTVGNIDVDIKAATTIDADITAQTVGNLGVDIKASTIGNIPMNINEQGVGDINIDLNAQTIGRVTVREHEGGAEVAAASNASCPTETETTLHTYSGSGSFKYALFTVSAKTDSHLIFPKIYIDGVNILPLYTIDQYKTYGYSTSSHPFLMIMHSENGVCHMCFYFDKSLPYDASIAFRVNNPSSTDTQNCSVRYFYYKLT